MECASGEGSGWRLASRLRRRRCVRLHGRPPLSRAAGRLRAPPHLHQLERRLAVQLLQVLLQIPHARLPAVRVDEERQRVVGHGDGAGGHAGVGAGLRLQVGARDGGLLVCGSNSKRKFESQIGLKQRGGQESHGRGQVFGLVLGAGLGVAWAGAGERPPASGAQGGQPSSSLPTARHHVCNPPSRTPNAARRRPSSCPLAARAALPAAPAHPTRSRSGG
jgi:hypothetical protein